MTSGRWFCGFHKWRYIHGQWGCIVEMSMVGYVGAFCSLLLSCHEHTNKRKRFRVSGIWLWCLYSGIRRRCFLGAYVLVCSFHCCLLATFDSLRSRVSGSSQHCRHLHTHIKLPRVLMHVLEIVHCWILRVTGAHFSLNTLLIRDMCIDLPFAEVVGYNTAPLGSLVCLFPLVVSSNHIPQC